LISNVIGHLGLVLSQKVKERQVALFYNVDPTLGNRIAMGINVTATSNYTVY
jgi:catalase